MKNDKSTLFLKRLGTGVCIMFLVILAVPAYAAGKERDGKADEDSHFIQVEKIKNGSYISDTYQVISETDRELVKTFCETKTEDGVSVRIANFHEGTEEVLMDCRYDTIRFPYFFERCSEDNKNIFYEFYIDQPVWEKAVRVEKSNKTYTLSYAQRIKNGGEDSEKAAGYEGRLWVTDENGKIVKRLVWQSDAPYKKVSWKRSGLYIEYADGSDRTCTQSEVLKDPAEAVHEKCMQIDFAVNEHPIDIEKYDETADQKYRAAYYRTLSGQDRVRTAEGEETYLKSYWHFQGDSRMADEIFLDHLIENAQFYYMDFDGDGLPELVMDIIGDGLHILKYLPDEDMVEIFLGYERMPYYHLLGSGQLFYRNGMTANKSMWRYDTVDADGRVSQIVFFMEDADYKPYKENADHWWDTAYWIYLDEELGMVQVDEECYREVIGLFMEAVDHAVPAKEFEEIFGAYRQRF